MIIKKLTICNFRSYYGVKEFVFSNKLNLILGSNGDGKTTFFEALNWVLTPTEAAKQNKEADVKLESLISAKMLRNLPDGESGLFDHVRKPVSCLTEVSDKVWRRQGSLRK